MEDKTCYFYSEGDCWIGPKAAKCCDPTYECFHYRAPVAYVTLKGMYLRIRSELVRRAQEGKAK
jgi:hypothetical protein